MQFNKKIFIIILIILEMFLFTKFVQAEEHNITEETNQIIDNQKDNAGVSEFIEKSKKYTSNEFSDLDINEILAEAISGKIDNTKIMKNTFLIFEKELKNAITTIGTIIIIIIINSILNCITQGLENKSISKIAYFAQYILIVTIILNNFSEIIELIKNSIDNMTDFTNLLIPIMVTLIISTGKITTGAIIKPIMIFMISVVGNFIKKFAIPVVLVSTTLGIISKISDNIQVGKLAKRLKSMTIWVIGIILTIFVTVISVNSGLSKGVDVVASKTAKAAISGLVPVVGKILGDAADSVIGCSNILKNAVGIVGVIIVMVISISPIIKLLIFMGVYYLGAAVCEPIADKNIVDLLEQIGDTFKILLGFMVSMSMMIIIGITLIIKISIGD